MLRFRSALVSLCFALLLIAALFTDGPQARAGDPHGLAVQIVRPGQSIQTAIDHAADGGSVFVLPGVYREHASATNGLEITKPVHLIGLSTPTKRVVLVNAGAQHNGIAVVPADRTQCMSCHSSLAPPFALLPGVKRGLRMNGPTIPDFAIRGFTIKDFSNNGLFTEGADGFAIVDVEAIGNKNYGIFPTLSKNGIIERSRVTGAADSGIWVETSDNVVVSKNLVEGNVVGVEVTNSDNVVLSENEARNNTVGAAVFILPFLSAAHAGAKRITVERNSIHDNNLPNAATPGTIPASLPPGVGIFMMGADDSLIEENRIARNNLVGVALLDFCIGFAGGPLDCTTSPFITPEFLADQQATNDRIVENLLTGNGTNPSPHPLAFAASDLALLSTGPGNCYRDNLFATSFSILGTLPSCPAGH